MNAQPRSRFLLGAAMVLAGISAACFGLRSADVEPIRGPWSAASYSPPKPGGGGETKTEAWLPPTAQPPGSGWRYEVFSPPEIFYDASSRRFTVAGMRVAPAIATASTEAAPFGLTLLAVRRGRFRLQLVGFAGGEGDYRGVFKNRETTGVLLAGAGRDLPKLGLTIDRFEVRRTEVRLPKSMTIHRLVATAFVRDARTGETVTLTSAAPCTTASLVATVTTAAEPERPIELRVGESLRAANAIYTIDRIRFAPPAIDVSRQTASPRRSDRRTLTVAADTTAPTPAPPSL
jgi:hypothetical protein